jgi:hypothetical protein
MGRVEKYPDGEYVKYEDYQKAVQEAYERGVKAGVKQEKDAAEYWRTH